MSVYAIIGTLISGILAPVLLAILFKRTAAEEIESVVSEVKRLYKVATSMTVEVRNVKRLVEDGRVAGER